MDLPTGLIRARLALAAALFLLAAGGTAASAGAAAQQRGWIAGVTQISFGCPGPVREGAPPCERWSRFPHARFTIPEQVIDRKHQRLVLTLTPTE